MTAVYQLHPVRPIYVLIREFAPLPKIGRPGRGRSAEQTVWGRTALYALLSGAYYRPIEEFETMMDEYCIHYKETLGLRRTPDALRKTVEWLRKARFYGIELGNGAGGTRSRTSIERVFKALRLPSPPRKHSRPPR